MSMGLKYKGGFCSLNNTLYEVEIYREGYTGVASGIAFSDDPLQIEWSEADKLEPVQSSKAILQLYSDTDRQFIDLYTVQAGSIRLDVYRNGSLYWSGTLDPELYEEPFAYKADYGVTLTFADMAILDRLNWSKTGFMTLREVITEALIQTRIRYGATEEHISTRLSQYNTDNILDVISVNLSNFFDEDGEPLSLREVLDETLRPFGLRLIQKGGKIVIYDLNEIYTAFNQQTVTWDSDDSTLAVDRVYNNVKLTFSPYEKTTMIKGEVDPKSVPGDGFIIRVDCTKGSTGNLIAPDGFKMALSDTGKGLIKSDKAKFFRIDPVYSGEASAGIAWTVIIKNNYDGDINRLQAATPTIGDLLLKVPETSYLGYVGLNRNKYKLKLTMQLLFDPRYNPFENASQQNYGKAFDNQKNRANYAYVPFILTLRDVDGKALLHWQNHEVKDGNSYVRKNCDWFPGEGAWGDAWMCWYQGNRSNESGLGGWQGNKQIIGYYRGDLPVLFDKMDMAEYIDLPTVSGWLELQIGAGVPTYDYKSDSSWQIRQEVYNDCRWILYKEPKIELVNKYSKSLDTEDIEHNAWINRSAKEELKIETILGTLKEPSPVAQGQLFKTADKSVQNSFFRAGVTDCLERLLIGTAYSNYSTRHNTLSGTTALLPSFGTYTDTNEPGKYLLLSETQHLRDDESEILMVQFEADNFEGVEFNETV